LAGFETGKIAVPTQCRHFVQIMARLSPQVIEQAKLNPLCNTGEEGKVHAMPVISGAKWIGFAAADSHVGKKCRLATGKGSLVNFLATPRTCAGLLNSITPGRLYASRPDVIWGAGGLGGVLQRRGCCFGGKIFCRSR